MKTVSKLLSFLIILAMSITLVIPVVQASDTTTLSTKSYGLDNLNNKKGNLYVAYLGGSITQGDGGSSNITYKDGAGNGHARWSSQLTKRYFQKLYPEKNVVEVNAGVRGTPSDLGLFRLQKDVVDPCGTEGPDVVFVEFAVNDKNESISNSVKVKQRMEGIVRTLARLPKQPVIIFVYTAANDDVNASKEGFDNYLKSAGVHQEVADYYGIGSINLCEYVKNGVDIEGNEIVWDKTKSNTWTCKGDNVHPGDRGYTGYTDYIMKKFNDSPKSYFKKLNWKNIPLSGYEFNSPKAVRYDMANADFTGTWKKSSRILGNCYETTQAGATVTVEFTGRSFGLYVARGPNGASATYTIDKGTAQQKNGTINTYGSGWMAFGMGIRWDLAPGNHTITIVTNHPSTEKNIFAFSYFFMDEGEPDPIIYDVEIKKNDKKIESASAGEMLTGSYVFMNSTAEESGSTYQWLASDSETVGYVELENQTGKTFIPDVNMTGKYVKFRLVGRNKVGVAKTIESAPVKIMRPSADVSFTANQIAYYKNDKPVGYASKGEIKAMTTVTNNISGKDFTVSMITAEYTVDANGNKTLIQVKKDTKTIVGGKKAEFSNSLNVTSDDSMIQTMIVSDDNLEPIGKVLQLFIGEEEKAMYITTDSEMEGIPVSVFLVNRLSD